MKTLLIIIFSFSSSIFIGQEYISSFTYLNPDKEFKNINIKKLFSDSNATTFAIWIKKSVRIHKHIKHVENLYISEGSGLFNLGDSTYRIKRGDFIVVPKNTWHGVKVDSKEIMKVISVQSPEFKGNDRIFKDIEN
jgi:quercetin dioxygenase-like cupin family protein